MTPEDFDRGFYSASVETKAATLKACVGSDLSVDAVADAICDGAGGCEQLLYGNVSQQLTCELVSPMYSDGIGCTYAYVKWEDQRITATAVVTVRPLLQITEDIPESLLYALLEGRDVVREQAAPVTEVPF